MIIQISCINSNYLIIGDRCTSINNVNYNYIVKIIQYKFRIYIIVCSDLPKLQIFTI